MGGRGSGDTMGGCRAGDSGDARTTAMVMGFGVGGGGGGGRVLTAMGAAMGGHGSSGGGVTGRGVLSLVLLVVMGLLMGLGLYSRWGWCLRGGSGAGGGVLGLRVVVLVGVLVL